MLITELKGVSICLNDNKGGTLRLLPRETKKIHSNLISEEIRIAINKGLVVLSTLDEKPTTNIIKEKEGDK